MDNHLHDNPAKYAAEDRRSQRTMLELRWLYGALDEDTQPVNVDADKSDRAESKRWYARVWERLRK